MATDLGQTPPAFIYGFGLTLVVVVLHTLTLCVPDPSTKLLKGSFRALGIVSQHFVRIGEYSSVI